MNFAELLQKECPSLSPANLPDPGAMIRQMLDDLNRLNWKDAPPLSGNEEEESFRLGEEVDRAALAGDLEALAVALDRYRTFWLKLRDKPGQALLFG